MFYYLGNLIPTYSFLLIMTLLKLIIMKNSILFSIFFVSIFFLNTSCSNDPVDSPESNQEIIYGDFLTKEDDDFIASISVSSPELDQMIGANAVISVTGKSSSSITTIIKDMLRHAQSLSHKKKGQPNEEWHEKGSGKHKPGHYGYVYSYGQRDFTRRLRPLEGSDLHKLDSVFGTDCSGLMITLLRAQGINIANTAAAVFEQDLKDAIKKDPKFSEIIVENKGRLDISEIKSGDFIVWKSFKIPLNTKQAHIGIVEELKNSSKIVFNSNGTSKPKDLADQTKNLLETRGIHWINLEKCLTHAHWSTNYEIIRMSSKKTPSNCDNSTLAVTTSTIASTVTATATGGQPPYTFLWSNATTGSTVINPPEGNYTVTVTDAANCTASTTTIISPPLVGQDGDPRFNLQFTNSDNVDLDLYVRTPSGAVISFSHPTRDNGTLDIDCQCTDGDCPQGPNENIFWEIGTAPSGTYEYWVEYYEYCGPGESTSTFTLRVTRNGKVLNTETGTLIYNGNRSTIYTFQQ